MPVLSITFPNLFNYQVSVCKLLQVFDFPSRSYQIIVFKKRHQKTWMGTIKGKVLSAAGRKKHKAGALSPQLPPVRGSLPHCRQGTLAPSTGHQSDAHLACTPRLEHSEHAWPWKCHLKPRLRIVAAQPFPQFSHLREKGKEGAGAIINYAIFFTTTSHRQLEHLMGDMAELQAINHSNIFTSECLNLQQHRFSETQCPEI